MKDKKSISKSIIPIFKLLSTLLFVAYITLNFIMKIRPINNRVNMLVYLLIIILGAIWLVIIVKKTVVKYKTLKLVLLSILISIFSFALVFNLIYGFMGKEERDRFISPSGENEIIVFEGGFIDAIYYAYPVKYKFFYQYQDNGFVSNHDDWGGAEIKIDWITDNEAIVKIISNFGGSNEGSNQNNEIVVTFK